MAAAVRCSSCLGTGVGTFSPTVTNGTDLRSRMLDFLSYGLGSNLELLQPPGPTVSLLWLFTALSLF
jgi:hypothetical protein